MEKLKVQLHLVELDVGKDSSPVVDFLQGKRRCVGRIDHKMRDPRGDGYVLETKDVSEGVNKDPLCCLRRVFRVLIQDNRGVAMTKTKISDGVTGSPSRCS